MEPRFELRQTPAVPPRVRRRSGTAFTLAEANEWLVGEIDDDRDVYPQDRSTPAVSATRHRLN
ncbi:MAG: hypothetical protein Q4G43_10355 [Mobilicoccus sp.]|nr:hypothetical protein [Mobilicoccus sp.]